ncbi:MAG TPA: phosphoribosyltransferase family protein [Aquabacterium sp.]|nr:phosphoribosyltransferase family protein [Aquabacterium sp.]
MLNALHKGLRRLSRHARMPSACRWCGTWQAQGVCHDCLHAFSQTGSRCLRCGLRLSADSLERICSSCLDYPPELDNVVVGVDFVPPWSEMVSALKFRADLAAAQVLADKLSQAVLATLDSTVLPYPDLIVPIPLSVSRWHERGYNQAWLLAQRVATNLGWKNRLHHATLIRNGDTGRLMQMKRDEREARIRGAFSVDSAQAHRVRGQHVVLVDDVMTTGATANAAARALYRAGAASVTGWFATRTPAPRQSIQSIRAAQ